MTLVGTRSYLARMSARAGLLSRVRWMAIAGIALPVFGLVFSGCASTGREVPVDSTYGAASAEDAVRGFLDAVQEQGYSRMRELFGTRDGPAERKWGVQDVEQRMIVLSGMLLHESYSLRPLELGYLGEHQRSFVARITGTRYGTVTLPITTIQAKSGRWFVEQLGMDSLTGGGDS